MCPSVTQCTEVRWPEFVSRSVTLGLKGSQLKCTGAFNLIPMHFFHMSLHSP